MPPPGTSPWTGSAGHRDAGNSSTDSPTPSNDPPTAGCPRVWLNGSFVTAKDEPADFDACWDTDGVDLDALDPIFFDFADGRANQKASFGGELFPNVVESGTEVDWSLPTSSRTNATVATRASSS